nr:MAG TPA: hypothetical protein [Caudoviricetes sp.]
MNGYNQVPMRFITNNVLRKLRICFLKIGVYVGPLYFSSQSSQFLLKKSFCPLAHFFRLFIYNIEFFYHVIRVKKVGKVGNKRS